MRRVFLALLILCTAKVSFAACGGSSPTWTAASAGRTDVNDCITAATTGDTINVPAGTATWSSAITFNKAVNLIGAGYDQTIITLTGGAFSISSGLDNFRISGFRFNNAGSDIFVIGSSGSSLMTGFRIDNNYLSGGSGRGMYLTGTVTNSVIDHNKFYGQAGTAFMWAMANDSAAFTSATDLGSNNFLFLEDNDFQKLNAANNNHAIMANGGGPRIVVRYNTITDGPGGRWADVIDMHGCCPSNTDRGARAWEIYGNTITRGYNSSDTCCSAFQIRGGTGVLYNNTVDVSEHSYNNIIAFREYRINPAPANRVVGCPGTRYTASTACPTSAGGEGYPCCDGLGRGPMSEDPVVVGTQDLEPVYLWGNKKQDGTDIVAAVWSGQSAYIQKNRDYYETSSTPKPGYTPYAYPHPLTGAASDTTPTQFYFTDVTDATTATPYTSDNVTMAGIDAASALSISGAGCQYSINGAAPASSNTTVVVGDNVALLVTSSGSDSATVNCTLTVGGVSDVYSVTTATPPPDTIPDAYTIVHISGADRSTVYTSASFAVAGINSATDISISGTGCTYSVGNGAFTSSAGVGAIVLGSTVRLRVTSSADYSTTANASDPDCTLTIGTVTGAWNVTTAAEEEVPASSTPTAPQGMTISGGASIQ